MNTPLTLSAVNALPSAEFVRHFGGVLEHSPRYAEGVSRERPFGSVEELAAAFTAAVFWDTPEQQLALIRAHPDLAGKAALAGEVTAESASEQASAGLDRLTPEEYAEFHRLNAAYHTKFDMPYIVCVREHTKSSILAGAAERLDNTPEQERETALREIGKIARLRVLDLVRQDPEGGPAVTQPQEAQPRVKVRLGENNYGKAEVQLFKVFRGTPRHEIRDVRVRVGMIGAFEAAHVRGDNSGLLATDTVRNTIYALAKEGFQGSVEEFGQELVRHFVETGPKVTGAFAEFTEHLWDRIEVGGQGHDHAFVRQMPRHTARVDGDGRTFKVTSGIEELYVLKTTQSGWAGYLLDERFTTLPETTDRIMATFVTAKWEYNTAQVNYDDVWGRVYRQIQETFTDHYSPSLQNTLYRMGEAVLTRCPEISRIWFQMPNKHHLKYNLERFGIENEGEIFHVDPEPYGLMEAWVERA
ncbi:factor-independent urate hydroxylase [Deinococcus apachensis]|uniref:factor-independent urate hydroxylase n=1 Tax=Deinococcus apachensis TaxID=309886 RepID=UPI00037AA1CD|nr:urate oxidase [Deinococcus apachensis]